MNIHIFQIGHRFGKELDKPSDNKPAANRGFGVIGASRCNLHLQQHGSFCSGRTNIGEHLFLSCTSATHQLRFRADVFQIHHQRQALSVLRHPNEPLKL